MVVDIRRRAIVAYPELSHFIDARWIGGDAAASSDVIDPTTEAVLGRVPHADEAQVGQAISAAQRAFAVWRVTPAIERSRLLRAVAAWLRLNGEAWAMLIVLELGKPIAQARLEVEIACEMFEWAAEEARRLYGRVIPGRTPNMRMMAFTDPVGPVAAISGWNAPAITPARKISGAVAAGCSLVIKPSEATPASALMIARAFEAADAPAGLLNMIFGDPPAIGRRFATDPAIRMITFTGGGAVGKSLAASCSDTLKRMVLELGGHAPALIFDDVDVPAVAAAAVAAKFRNAGQVCTSPTRFLVQDSALEPFVEAFKTAALALRVGDPFDPDTQMGPLQNARRVSAIQAMTDDASRQGATVARGMAPNGPGFWSPPTVVSAFPDTTRARNEEPFGPIALISGFSSTDDAIAEANRMSFGLAAYAFTGDLRTEARLARESESGTLAINHWAASFPETPFGGVKESGLGVEGGSEGLAAFQQVRFVSVSA